MRKHILIYICLSLLLAMLNTSAKVGIIINKNLYPFIKEALHTYITDVNTIEKKKVWVNSTSFDETNTIYELRKTLQEQYSTNELEGVVLVGDLPIVQWHDTTDDRQPLCPTEYFYMDLDGEWTVGPMDAFHKHTGNKEMEIWLSRITAGVLDELGDEEEVVNKYFKRVHERMTGNDKRTRTYLLLGNSEDWSNMDTENKDGLGYNKDSIEIFKRPDDTWARWKEKISGMGQEYTLLYEHSNQKCHSLYDKNFSYDDLISTDHDVRFFNLFACSNAQYDVKNMGGVYALGGKSLISLGSTKGGSMLRFEIYNTPLKEGKSFGEAFKIWSTERGIKDASWHYGMTLQGVGTLKVQPYEISTSIKPVQAESAMLGLQFYNTHVHFQIPEELKGKEAQIIICDLRGKIIRTVLKKNLHAGNHSIDVLHDQGRNREKCAAGLYLCTVKAGKFIKTINMIVKK